MEREYSKRMGMTPEKALVAFKSSHESKLKYLRVKAGLSQQQLADVAGVKKRVLQTYEQGERNINHGQLDILCAICVALNCQLKDILEDEELIQKLEACK